PIKESNIYCRRALADGLKKQLKKKRCAENMRDERHLMTAQLLHRNDLQIGLLLCGIILSVALK
ncbi:MAG: hypothetical protein EA361_18875, partial [Bacteroidetes bacterium]